MADNDLDAIVAPTNNPAWVTDPVNGDSFEGFISLVEPARHHRLRRHHGPDGLVGPLPVGLSFIGGRWDEPTLIGLAYAYEQATHVRVKPQYLPTIGANAAPAKHGNAATRSADAHRSKSAMVRAR